MYLARFGTGPGHRPVQHFDRFWSEGMSDSTNHTDRWHDAVVDRCSVRSNMLATNKQVCDHCYHPAGVLVVLAAVNVHAIIMVTSDFIVMLIEQRFIGILCLA